MGAQDSTAAFDAAITSFKAVADRVQAIAGELQELQRKRAGIIVAPMTQDDYLAVWQRQNDKYAATFERDMVRNIEKLGAHVPKPGTGNFLLNAHFAGIGSFDGVTSGAFYYFCGEQVSAGLKQLVSLAEWPDGAIAQADRPALLAEIDRQSATLQGELSDLAGKLQAAGLEVPTARPVAIAAGAGADLVPDAGGAADAPSAEAAPTFKGADGAPV